MRTALDVMGVLLAKGDGDDVNRFERTEIVFAKSDGGDVNRFGRMSVFFLP